jgi:uncharacterized phiE125 gp8 family phage protein
MLSLKTLKRHCVVDHDRDDDLLDIYLNSAIGYCEGVVGRPIKTATFVDLFENLFTCLPLRVGTTSITLITYLDVDGVRQTLANTEYELVTTGLKFQAAPQYNVVYPVARATYGSVEVTYIAGWASAPAEVEAAAYMFAANLYEFREAEVIGTISTTIKNGLDSLLKKHAVPVI